MSQCSAVLGLPVSVRLGEDQVFLTDYTGIWHMAYTWHKDCGVVVEFVPGEV